ncbi:CidA/LrgA family holin-like protein [Paenibacillus glycanilyticus]|uniref:CidA/LrgA family protein n=1 Tax=Paenibacillus glycanilyticus TaxID=126569 RepID=UPI00203BC6FE|nr:CidA/LrgA family holin-like protein [Paenibacillus glycanilyticus]MCM3626982.1 CidA/LrgA family holin-like protein [Paenibacillus glycanilyticus]
MRYLVKLILQILFFIGLSWLMNRLAEWLHLPVPGSVLGMLLLFILLQARIIPRRFVESGSDWLIATMLLFFIPPAVGIIGYRQLILSSGVQIALVIALGTIIVMLCSGLVAQQVAKRKGGTHG